MNRNDLRAEGRRRFDFNQIKIQLASPDVIRSWSSGEVTKPETINYRSFKPEKDGLFCERIFGPVKDWECSCGKYKRIRYRGVICDRCGVEVTQAKVRRERMGHVELAVPVSHIWFFKGVPSRIGHLLNMSIRDLERVLYYESYVVVDPGNTGLKERELLSEDAFAELENDSKNKFDAQMGAEAIRALLANMELDDLSSELRTVVKMETSAQRKKETLKRLRIVEAFRHSGNKPDWMILEVVPVLPPDLRPLVPLEGGRFATSDLNDLYRRVINRNNRLKKLMEIRAPEVILRNEKRMLQESVDALFDNGRRSRAVRGQGNRPLKSISDMLKGKQGRFRQNLLGKRVDYSGRSVIVVGPDLKLHQCGLPKSMALELFKPFIIKNLEDRGFVSTVKSAKRLVERETPEVWEILGRIIKGHPVLLNRAPTLHRLGIQAFEPVLVEGKAIRLHPLVCAAFNADFDGDQMAVHVPLGFEAQLESRELMLSSTNILSPASGRPVATPSQDIVLGGHYLTRAGKLPEGRDKERRFSSSDEVHACFEHDYLTLHEPIKVRIDGELIDTTPGRVIFNSIIPDGIPYENITQNKKSLGELVARCYQSHGTVVTSRFLDDLKRLGFTFATRAGITVGIDDIRIPEEKKEMIAKASAAVEKIRSDYAGGQITEDVRYNQIIDTWSRVAAEVEIATFEGLARDREGFNPIFMMADSGARGSREQIRQLAGMRGLMAKPQKKITGGIGEIIESPVIRNFKEGLTVLEYFISTHGARKGLADTALKTADAGYLTRRLVDVAQDVIITEDDCGTILGIERGALKEGEEVIEPISERILGRVAADDVYDPIENTILVEAGGHIAEAEATAIEDASVDAIKIRSVLTCETKLGVCALCYGRNLATNRMVDHGEAVGVIAAQSIGEPGTQLTLRTFHVGGIAARIVEQSQISAKFTGSIRTEGLNSVERKELGHYVVTSHKGTLEVLDEQGRMRNHYNPPYGAILHFQDGDKVEEGDSIFEWDTYNTPILSERNGTIRFGDIKDRVTVREEVDDNSGRRTQVIIDDKEKVLQPAIDVLGAAGQRLAHYPLPTGATLLVKDGDKVMAGDPVARIRRELSKTADITGGLPRVSELFEARKPKDAASVTEIDGTVSFGGITRGMRKLIVTNENEDTKEYLIPQGKHLHVQEGSEVTAGDRLTDGPINPHDILRIKGIKEVQEYLVEEIQEVYRLQGVRIDDKHIEVVVRQMLQKVRIEDPGDSMMFLEGDQVDKVVLRQENDRIERDGGQPATYVPLLLGITKASLSTQSFISAASFQETTRILTEASIRGSIDYLRGLKENVTIGNLIPAGTGLARYRKLRVVPEESELMPFLERETVEVVKPQTQQA
ncbi:MAG: DNA-directed RNA polymerase subunit beta' [Candidatus Eisenbacteria bacterium]|uniref:DNA-directed RNA polymerase subunit beta' n=1 Tax=Eiseniibacteriota bacterium TaxID=2212470 RepID=A0A7Y2H3Z8_UNCEI|nr:DNA-directed RNA polymerase subunit beta' [Candidatus Eisenbacteria bacterium]